MTLREYKKYQTVIQQLRLVNTLNKILADKKIDKLKYRIREYKDDLTTLNGELNYMRIQKEVRHDDLWRHVGRYVDRLMKTKKLKNFEFSNDKLLIETL